MKITMKFVCLVLIKKLSDQHRLFLAGCLLMVVFFSAACFPGVAHCNDNTVFVCMRQLEKKYSSAAALREEFNEDYYGDDVTWEVITEQDHQDPSAEMTWTTMNHPGINILVLETEDSFFLVSVTVEEAGFGGFLGIDKGSSKEDLLRVFGEPDYIEHGFAYKGDESGEPLIRFELNDQNEVWRMIYANRPAVLSGQ